MDVYINGEIFFWICPKHGVIESDNNCDSCFENYAWEHEEEEGE